MPCLDDIQVEDVVESDHILLFENTDVSIYIEIFQMFLPLIEADLSYDFSEHLLKRCWWASICAI